MSRKMKTEQRTALELCRDISKRLDTIEDLMAWTTKAHQRFKAGERVEFSPYADRRRISQGTKGGARTGKIMAVDDYSVRVLIDGYKQPQSYHHSFWMPTLKRKKFRELRPNRGGGKGKAK